ncbi:MAG: zinc ribbon domain-containing protein [Smithella sp.]
MICPKCGAEQKEGNWECIRCGVIFAKLTQEDFLPLPAEDNAEVEEKPGKTDWIDILKIYILGSGNEENPFFWAGRVLVYLVILIWGWKFIKTPIASDYFAQTFLHGVNLAFHEAGHVIFSFFGSFIGILGGTLGQITMPFVCLGAFLFYRNPFAASVALWWMSENFLDIAPYINDARALQLPLLGGNIGEDNPDFHDWHHLLRDLGMLQYDHTLALIFNRTGILLMLISFIWGGFLLYRQYKSIHLDKI